MFWDIAYAVCWLIFKSLYRFKAIGKENVPKTGRVIFVSNHKSYLDPVIVGLACYPRRISYMAKEELFQVPILKNLIKWLYAFPVKRERIDKKALKSALRVLREEGALGMFPEGTRRRSETLGSPHQGVVMIASKTKTPIVPIGILGANKVFPDDKRLPRFPKIRVRIGTPLEINDNLSKEELQRISENIMTEIAQLIPKG